ncbi:HD-GYP domain-containing protein [Chloroflexota bacterium]
MSASVASAETGEIEVILSQWRRRAMTVILAITAVAALPALVTSMMLTLSKEAGLFMLSANLLSYLLLLAMLVFRKLDHRLRGSVLLGVGYLLGVINFTAGGLAGGGREYLMVMPIFAFVLMGIRSGWIATGLSFIIYIAFSIFAHVGILGNWLRTVDNPVNLDFWMLQGATMAMLLIMAVALIERFHRLQWNTLKAERQVSAELAQAYDSTLEGWGRALELRDHETEGHCQRVTELTRQVALEQGLDASELVHVHRGALLHDIGKMGIPDSILLKPDKLTDDEWEIMRLHPVYANEMLSPITFLSRALHIPYSHHEKWDGTGYPRRLREEQIPLAARIFAVVDVWDALTSDRPYRQAWPQEKVLTYIRERTGTEFDPQVVEAFLSIISVYNNEGDKQE